MTGTLRLLKSVLPLRYTRYKNDLIYFLFPPNKIIMLLFSPISAIKKVSLFKRRPRDLLSSFLFISFARRTIAL
jgi:hypothetical protein